MTKSDGDTILTAAIIGAGFSGIGMGITLCRAGIHNFVVFEKSGGVGGTWYDNTYPGAACDVPSHLYRYSFAPKPDWTYAYARQEEIKSYVEDCARDFGVTGNIRLNTVIEDVRFDEQAKLWVLRTSGGEQWRARFVISATGPLSVPFTPPIKGLNRFKGAVFHSARWQQDIALDGKDVAMIGNAASAIQIAPEIAKSVGFLNVFQRTPNYILPRRDRIYSASQKALWRKFPMLLRAKYALMAKARDVFSFRAFKKHSLLAKWFSRHAIAGMKEIVLDPAMRANLTPDYPLGCKRILLSDDYYQTLLRSNVNLISDGIASIDEHGLCTRSGRHIPADIIVFATGFDTTKFLGAQTVIGREGKNLQAILAKTPTAYRGVSYPGFPNFFTLLGPNTGLGHSSVIIMAEAQFGYILKLMQRTDAISGTSLAEVQVAANANYNAALYKDLEKMVWAANCASWYKRPDGTNPFLWPHSTAAYRQLMARPDFDDYQFTD